MCTRYAHAGGGGMAERSSEHEHVRVAVIGSGFGGLGAAVRLRREGITDFVVLERAGSRRRHLAGQQLPGVRLRRALPPLLVLLRAQPRLAAHLLRAGAHPRLPGACRRHLRAAAAHPLRLRGADDALGRGASCAGRSRPRSGHAHRRRRRLRHRAALRPEDPGRSPGSAGFPGKVFHSARWDHDYDLRGKRVADDRHRRLRHPDRARDPAARSARLTLFQRTPPWVMPRMDRAISGVERWLHRQLPFTAPAAARTAVGHPGVAGPGLHQAARTSSGCVESLAKAQHGARRQGPGAAAPS